MTWLLKPAPGSILVQAQKDEEKTTGGLILVAPAVERETHIAEVIEVCDPYQTQTTSGPSYRIGQLVVVGKYNGREISIRHNADQPESKYTLIRETDVLGVLTEVADDTNFAST